MHEMNRFVFFSLLLLCLGLSSCSSGGSGVQREKVIGKVTLNNEALEGAIIIFESVGSGISSFGVTDTEGRYVIKSRQDEPGAPIGKYVVKISKQDEELAGQELIPVKYNAKSELTADIKASDNQINFDLHNK